MKFETLHQINAHIGRRHYAAAARHIDKALETEPGIAWNRELSKLAAFLRDPRRVPFATIIAQGNGKLPFLAFSALPGITCPGAGECLDFCYSFKAWRYPAAYVRQVQNTVLLWSNPAAILADLDKHRTAVDFRLYVDGDFDSVDTVNFWWDALAARPWLRTYGYSKSFTEVLAAKKAPNNYRLNISSGHNHGQATVKRVTRLACTRGVFVAVNIGRKVSSSDHGQRAHNRELRQAYGKNAFTCPGKCGECTPIDHACGSDRFKNVDIIIAAH